MGKICYQKSFIKRRKKSDLKILKKSQKSLKIPTKHEKIVQRNHTFSKKFGVNYKFFFLIPKFFRNFCYFLRILSEFFNHFFIKNFRLIYPRENVSKKYAKIWKIVENSEGFFFPRHFLIADFTKWYNVHSCALYGTLLCDYKAASVLR